LKGCAIGGEICQFEDSFDVYDTIVVNLVMLFMKMLAENGVLKKIIGVVLTTLNVMEITQPVGPFQLIHVVKVIL